MRTHTQNTLIELGYTPNEARVYVATLELGESTITDISVKARLPRTSCYAILGKLRHGGLVNYYIKRKRRYWLAENPSRLLSKFKAREATLVAVLPDLQALQNNSINKPRIRFFDGAEGIKLILDDIIQEKKGICALTSVEDAVRLLDEDFQKFISDRYHHYLRVRFLTNKSPETELMRKRDAEELRVTRFLPKDKIINNANFIYGDKVAIISFNKRQPIGIMIEDKDIAQTLSLLFDELWANCDFAYQARLNRMT